MAYINPKEKGKSLKSFACPVANERSEFCFGVFASGGVFVDNFDSKKKTI